MSSSRDDHSHPRLPGEAQRGDLQHCHECLPEGRHANRGSAEFQEAFGGWGLHEGMLD